MRPVSWSPENIIWQGIRSPINFLFLGDCQWPLDRHKQIPTALACSPVNVLRRGGVWRRPEAISAGLEGCRWLTSLYCTTAIVELLYTSSRPASMKSIWSKGNPWTWNWDWSKSGMWFWRDIWLKQYVGFHFQEGQCVSIRSQENIIRNRKEAHS